MLVLLSLFLGTFVSEDLACIAAGLLIQQGTVGAVPAVVACALGILVGDIGLWVLGRLGGRAAISWPWAARRIGHGTTNEVVAWLERHAGTALLLGRFLPGTRLPLYVTAGFVGLPLGLFTRWASVAVILWTPALVLAAAWAGQAAALHLSALLGASGSAALVAGAVFAGLHAVRRMIRPEWRVRAAARLARWSRWEFWPMWLFYAPVALWVGLLGLRHRGLTTITAANPGIPDGGTVGESKHAILQRLPADATIPATLIESGAPAARMEQLLSRMQAWRWTFPLILKPDVGQRGAGVRLVKTPAEASAYLSGAPHPVIAQVYHPGPYEAGVFYYRMPSAARGRVLSITDKHFPVLVGDGSSSIEQLVWAHPRYSMQASTFLSRHHEVRGRVLAAGERFRLAIAGNHAQGTLFRDGRRLLTPALERRIDEIARAFPGFYVGRFDIRYRDEQAFKEGRDLAIVELNGATAESTNIYDPDGSLWGAYRQLFRQWAIVFAIGAANRSNGATVSSWWRLASLLHAHLTTRVAFEISD